MSLNAQSLSYRQNFEQKRQLGAIALTDLRRQQHGIVLNKIMEFSMCHAIPRR